MRVLLDFIAPQANKLSGISVYTFSVIEALIRRGRHDYSLLTNWDVGNLPGSIASSIEVHSRPTSTRLPILFWQGAFHAQRLATALRSDLIFSTYPFGALAGGSARVAVMHDVYPRTHPQFHSVRTRVAWKLLVPLVLRRSQRIVCVSQATKDDLLGFHPEAAGQAVVVHEASTVSDAAAVAAKQASAPFPQPYGLLVANSSPNKNLDRVVDALSRLDREGTAIPVYWIGRDDSGTVAAARSKFGETRNFISVGPVTDDVLRAAYAHASLYINASLVEGFCLPILEAQKLGVPVVCSDIPVLREVAGMGARYTDPQDAGALAATLRELWNDPEERRRMRDEGYRNVARFSWDKAAAELEEVFVDALAAA